MKNWPFKPSKHLAEFLHEQGETFEDEQELGAHTACSGRMASTFTHLGRERKFIEALGVVCFNSAT